MKKFVTEYLQKTPQWKLWQRKCLCKETLKNYISDCSQMNPFHTMLKKKIYSLKLYEKLSSRKSLTNFFSNSKMLRKWVVYRDSAIDWSPRKATWLTENTQWSSYLRHIMYTWDCFRKKLHLRCLTGFWIASVYHRSTSLYSQNQPSRGVLMKRCSDNMQQIYRRTPMPQCDVNKAALQLNCNHTST